jgi:hypothetical protein
MLEEKLRAFLERHYQADFDFEQEHGENRSYDDSYDYGVESGRQEIYRDILEILGE